MCNNKHPSLDIMLVMGATFRRIRMNYPRIIKAIAIGAGAAFIATLATVAVSVPLLNAVLS